MKSAVRVIYNKMSFKMLNKFQLFVESAYFNKNETQVKLHLLLRNKKIIDDFILKKELFANKGMSISSYKKLFATHLSLLKRFFILEKSIPNELFWLKTLVELNISNTDLRKEINKINKKSKEKKVLINRTHNLEDLKLMYFEGEQLLKEPKIQFGKIEKNFIDKKNWVDSFYIYQKLKILCDYYNLESVLDVSITILWKKEIEKYLKRNSSEFNFLINLYWKVVQVKKDLNLKNIFDEIIIDLDSEEFKNIEFNEQKELYQHIVGLCIVLIVRKNMTKLNVVLHQLYKTALEHNYLSDYKSYINQRIYKNIIRCSLNSNDIEWAKTILTKAKNFIVKEELKDASNYNWGVYYYFMSDYSKSLMFFSRLPYDNLYYAIDLRVYLMRIYFLTEESDLLFSMIESFRTYLKRNKTFSESIIFSLRNFINSIKRLASISKRDKKKLIILQINVNKTDPIMEKKWLLSIIEERLNKLSY